MSFQRSTRYLKNEVLTLAGELTDGSSQFDADAVKYLNKVYQGLIAGGNEFGIDVAEPWTWAQSKRPMALTLEPSYNGAVTFVSGALNGTLTSAYAYSLTDRYLRFTNQSELYRIVKHDAGTSAISVDQPIRVGGTYSFSAYKLEYDLVDNIIVIDESNQYLDFREAAASVLTASIPRGAYRPSELCLAIKTQMETVGLQHYTISFDTLTRRFSVATDGSYLDLVFGTGPRAERSISETLGFDLLDQKGATTYASQYALSGIVRLSKPIKSSKSMTDGLIYMVDDNTMEREYSNLTSGLVPDKFSVVNQSPSGVWRVRFNSSITQAPVRLEVGYIPVARNLVDSDFSFPRVPGSYADYLIYAAAFYLLTDKSDNKSETYGSLAKAKLLAMVNDARKNVTQAGNNYGRILARGGSGIRRVFKGYR